MGSQKGARSKLADVLADIKNSRAEDEYEYNSHDLAPTPAKRRAAVNYVALSGHTPRQSRSSNLNSRSSNQASNVESKTPNNTSSSRNRTCILKLFERNVDLGPFSHSDPDKIPLYPICRSWIHGHHQTVQQAKSPVRLSSCEEKVNESSSVITQELNGGDVESEVNLLPAPKRKADIIREFNLGPEDKDIDIRIPQSVRDFKPRDDVGLMIDKSICSMSHEECLEANKERWKKVKNDWREARKIHESRYEDSFRLLQDMFMTSQRAVATTEAVLTRSDFFSRWGYFRSASQQCDKIKNTHDTIRQHLIMSNHEFYSDLEDDRPSLSLGERIVWISDNGPEFGNVRWLGKLYDLGEEWMAGVEFDNPVGSGTGLYKDKQLFVTPLNHASLVPVIGLLKASDFGDNPQPPRRTSSTRLIDFVNDQEYEHHKSDPLNLVVETESSNYHHTGDLWNESNHKTKRSPLNKNQVLENQSNKLNQSRVRHIPITIEDYKLIKTDSLKSASHHKLSNSLKPLLPAKPKKLDTTYKNLVDEVASNLKDTSLNGKTKTKPTAGISSVPQPALIVPVDEKNPSSFLKHMLGKSRGIQGHNNSCYLDATLFAMYSSTTLFDSLLYRPRNELDIPNYDEIQHTLREDIVRPLREEFFVGADQVMVFRTMLEQSSTVAGLTDEEKDPEEFLSLLLNQILKAEPYLKLSSGLESFFYQLIVDKDESVVLPTVQDLFEQSFMNSTVRLREIPPCLLLQMPRFGRQYKMYSRIMPSLQLDITDVLEAVPRACGHRGKDCDNLAKYECKGCFKEKSGRHDSKLTSITYCNNCFRSKHFGKSHTTGIEDHDLTKTNLEKIPSEAASRYSNRCSNSKDREIPRIQMELFAVLCIETSHYVCFVKCGENSEAPWCFFDSMADRRGEQNGYNIPEIVLFEEFLYWTSDKGVSYLLNHKDDKPLPEMARRLLCDAYLCLYRYPGLMTYRSTRMDTPPPIEPPFEDETIVERILGLQEMFPERLRNAVTTVVSKSGSFVNWAYSTTRVVTWFVCSTAAILILPASLEMEREEYEKQVKNQERSIILGADSGPKI